MQGETGGRSHAQNGVAARQIPVDFGLEHAYNGCPMEEIPVRTTRLNEMSDRRTAVLAVVTAVVASLVLCVGRADCGASSKPPILGQEQLQAMRLSLVGTWTCDIGQVRKSLRLGDDGRFQFGAQAGQYRIVGNTLLLHNGDSEIAYEIKLEGKKLTLSGGDLARALECVKVPQWGEAGGRLGDWSLASVKTKLHRIGVVVLAVLANQILLRLLRALARHVIYSEWGPLRYLYRRHKKRSMTLYSLFLNLSKYVIYLLALGFVLTELGVNYTVYFASLSVIGLAIGFGSQGLVQDMVTGFFIVFEEQFNVGDMVEIPPHTGVVEELGLRMTRLRNYVGQRIVIPNRNIAAVGNYVHGAQQVYLDVAVTQGARVGEVKERLRQAVQETRRQFEGVVLSASASPEEVSLATDERFVRLQVAIWPQQQWVIDQELLPRIRTVLKEEGLDIPGDKITVFYHPREKRSASRGR